ncbi:MAG: hypothetical protein AAF368_12990 [Planctomycetota bacterium]
MHGSDYTDLRFELAKNGDLRVTATSATGARVRLESISCETWMCERIARKRLSSELERLVSAIDLATRVLAGAMTISSDSSESRVEWGARILERALCADGTPTRIPPSEDRSRG